MSTLAEELVKSLRVAAKAYAPGDQVAPCVVLWPDPERLWEGVVPALQVQIPELFLLGTYAPERRTGPAVWLRCIEARVVEGSPPADAAPILYLPGISREQLRAVEDCPQELTALVELQYRGEVWAHVNGKEWTPLGFLVSRHGGLELDVARDEATHEALGRALPSLMTEPVSQLKGKRLNSDFFNDLLAPDSTGLVLRWLGDPKGFEARLSIPEWKAFCEQCKSDLGFDPGKDGPLKAARSLAERQNSWNMVWQRFAEAPANYLGIVEWLRKAAPQNPSIFDSAEVWPSVNDAQEQELRRELELMGDRPQDEVIRQLADLEARHGGRRGYVWQKLGLSPLAKALEPLAQLAEFCKSTPGAPDLASYAEYYAADGWRVDAAALVAMAAVESPDYSGAVLRSLRAVYLPWLEATARHLQKLVHASGHSLPRRSTPIAAAPGRLVMFVDGLRLDIAQKLAEALTTTGWEADLDWDWSTIPSVTPSGKPAASPVVDAFLGRDAGDEFAPRLISTEKVYTQDRFVGALKEREWQVLADDQTGDPSGQAWTEAGTLDSRGHAEGWKLARSLSMEVRELAGRVAALLKAGWTDVVVVTDHGWLLIPGGLPKIELKSFLAEHRWGRSAAMKPDAPVDATAYHWSWNPDVAISCPPGVGCYIASVEYSHGGVSLQELVTPVLRVRAGTPVVGSARLLSAKWVGARCRVTIGGAFAGLRVDIRTSPSDPGTSLLSSTGLGQDLNPDGTVTLLPQEDDAFGKVAEIVLLDSTGQVVDSLETKLEE